MHLRLLGVLTEATVLLDMFDCHHALLIRQLIHGRRQVVVEAVVIHLVSVLHRWPEGRGNLSLKLHVVGRVCDLLHAVELLGTFQTGRILVIRRWVERLRRIEVPTTLR